MATTRQTAPFQIYQDAVGPQTMPHNTIKPRPQLQPSAMPLQPMSNSRTYPNSSSQPPMAAMPHLMSPLKSQQISPPMQQYHQLSYVPIQPPLENKMYAGSPVKRGHMYSSQQYHHAPVPAQPMFSTFNSNLEAFPQGNFQVLSTTQNESVDFPVPSYPRRPPMKRSLSDATALGDRPLKRFRQEEDDSAQVSEPKLPEPHDMPLVDDDGGKPGYSYAQMIGMAILRAPNRRLTLSQIYDWISSTFAHYREDPKQGWHNSIRHNLSLNKAFKKQERPKGDAGKGSYWVIEPGMEAQFFREKSRKSNNINGMTIHQNGMRAEMHTMAQPLAEAMTPSWSIQVPPVIPPRPQTAPALPELSSDATLPASDPALNEEDGEGDEPGLTSAQIPSSPMPVMNSSPPVAASNHHRAISSPVQNRPASTRQHKRSVTAVQDSGYYSELPSSIRRPKTNGIILTSEIDRPRKQRGRAEEEILRMRSSPHVTPKTRRFSAATSDLGLSSSPNRPSPSVQLNPATPAVHFKKPFSKPPPSISPNTQLQRHRLMMQDFTDSPIKGAGLPGDSLPDFSPQFKMPLSAYRAQFDEDFAIFDENLLNRTPITPGLASSPLKSSKKPVLLRSQTSIGILRTVSSTGPRLNAKTPSKQPTLKPPFQANTFTGSPLKKMVQSTEDSPYSIGLNAFDAFDDENTFINFEDPDDGNTLINDENSSTMDGDDDGHFDLAKGFANIGQPRPKSLDFLAAPEIKRQRPPLGRSFTTRF